MFRVKGEERQDRIWHEKTIRCVADIDLGAGIILSATYFEWCVRRSILALGSSSVSDLSCQLCNPGLNFDGLVELWNKEVAWRFGNDFTLPMVFDHRKNKPKFGNLSLTWQNIQKSRKRRHSIVHGDRCSPLEIHGRKYVDLLIAASAVLSTVVEENGYSIFNIIRRKKRAIKEVK
jgi:hypothetical protein